MSTLRLPILGFGTVPDTSGDVFFEPYSIKSSQGTPIFHRLVLIFNNSSAEDAVHGSFLVPENYVGTANIVILWTSTNISGDVDFHFDYRAIGESDLQSLDQATFQEATTSLNNTGPTIAHERMETSISLTDANFEKGDTVQFDLARDSSADDKAAAVIVVGLYFEYNDV